LDRTDKALASGGETVGEAYRVPRSWPGGFLVGSFHRLKFSLDLPIRGRRREGVSLKRFPEMLPSGVFQHLR
jgi:hypothetical protein